MEQLVNLQYVLEALQSREFHMAMLTVTAIIVAAVLSYYVSRTILRRIFTSIARRTRQQWDDAIRDASVLSGIALYMPPAVIKFFGDASPHLQGELFGRLMGVYIACVTAIVAFRAMDAALNIYNTFEFSRRRPIKGYIQLAKLFVMLLTAVVAISQLVGHSPWTILSGVGALTAVLLIIFRDTILSVVASVQIFSNDMLRVGDWIRMDAAGADGTVVEVALNTVKVQNFDNTIAYIPTYKLGDTSFVNYRGMQESGGRRIKRAVHVDQSTIRFLSDDEVEDFKRISILRPYLEQKQEELARWNGLHVGPEAGGGSAINHRRLTNIGTFRAWLAAWLATRNDLRRDMTFLVRLLEPGPTGLPVEIYVFTATTVWAEFESIQSDIFDRVLAAAGEFDLRIYQLPSDHCAQSSTPSGQNAAAIAAAQHEKVIPESD